MVSISGPGTASDSPVAAVRHVFPRQTVTGANPTC